MPQTTEIPESKLRRKSFTYKASIEWVGDRSGVLRSPGKEEFRVSSPPEFRGEEGLWSPEDLFVASVNICQMTTFVAFASKLSLPVETYFSTAEGTLEYVDGKYKFTKIVLRPTVLVTERSAIAQVEKVLHDAHRNCLISNSITAEVVLEPEVGALGFE